MPRDRLGRLRSLRGWLFTLPVGVLLSAAGNRAALAEHYVPASDDAVLAEVSTGTRYADVSARRLARARVDVAIPLAQFYIQQSRLSGDLRYLGYAEAVLAPWVQQSSPNADVLVLQATLLQSRHERLGHLAGHAELRRVDPVLHQWRDLAIDHVRHGHQDLAGLISPGRVVLGRLLSRGGQEKLGFLIVELDIGVHDRRPRSAHAAAVSAPAGAPSSCRKIRRA